MLRQPDRARSNGKTMNMFRELREEVSRRGRGGRTRGCGLRGGRVAASLLLLDLHLFLPELFAECAECADGEMGRWGDFLQERTEETEGGVSPGTLEFSPAMARLCLFGEGAIGRVAFEAR
jgi:hypothetical protein